MLEIGYHAPTTIADVIAHLAADGARPLAGGTDLVPQMREGRRLVTHVVDLKRVPELTTIAQTTDGGWRIGSAASIGALARHAGFVAAHPGLVESARLVGSLQIQNRATLGGNLCNAAPSADAVPLLIALGAAADVTGPAGRRLVPVETVPIGPGRTSLAAGEIVTALLLPAKQGRSASRYLRMTPRREMDIAVAGAGAAISLDESTGNINFARVALASVAPTPLLSAAAARALVGQRPTRELFRAAGEAAAADAKPISDTRGSADYRRRLVAVLSRRALENCARDLGIDLT